MNLQAIIFDPIYIANIFLSLSLSLSLSAMNSNRSQTVCYDKESLVYLDRRVFVHPFNEIVSMIRKYHIHKLQTNPWHRKEEPHNNHEAPERQTKQSNQLSLLHQDDCKTRMDIK